MAWESYCGESIRICSGKKEGRSGGIYTRLEAKHKWEIKMGVEGEERGGERGVQHGGEEEVVVVEDGEVRARE